MSERRTYKETHFWVFIGAFIITGISEYFGVSIQQVTDYVEGIGKKTYQNLHYIVLWAYPFVLLIKTEIRKWRESKDKLTIELEKIRNGKASE
jgi:hypothetical protein